jgi:hypothetical protein
MGDRPARDGCAMSAPLTGSEAREELARLFHWKMEHLDPSEDSECDALPEHKKEFFRLCITAILNEAVLVRAALE